MNALTGSDTAISDRKTAELLIRSSQAILIDWDGCAAVDNIPRPDAIKFMLRHLQRSAIVSNNSTHTPEKISLTLNECGVPFPSERIFLAGAETIHRASEQPDIPTLVLGSPLIRAYARNLGLNLVKDEGQRVILLRDTHFTYARLQRAVLALQDGANLLVANPDLTHPGKRGAFIPETGALLASIKSCVDLSKTDLQVVGKPEKHLFLKACDSLNTTPDKAVMIGDSPATDIAGAHALKMPSILLLSEAGLTFSDLMGNATVLSIAENNWPGAV